MDNNRLKLLKQYIGKPFSGSPSPFANWLNGIVISASEKSVEFQFTVRKEMTNQVGMLHGGVISGMIDDCIGITFFIIVVRLKIRRVHFKLLHGMTFES